MGCPTPLFLSLSTSAAGGGEAPTAPRRVWQSRATAHTHTPSPLSPPFFFFCCSSDSGWAASFAPPPAGATTSAPARPAAAGSAGGLAREGVSGFRRWGSSAPAYSTWMGRGATRPQPVGARSSGGWGSVYRVCGWWAGLVATGSAAGTTYSHTPGAPLMGRAADAGVARPRDEPDPWRVDAGRGEANPSAECPAARPSSW